MRTSPPVDAGFPHPTGSGADLPLPAYPSSTERVTAARREIDDEVSAIRTLAGRAKDLVFAHQHARKAQWEALVDRAHQAYLGLLDRALQVAVSVDHLRTDELQKAEEKTEAARSQVDEAVLALGPGRGVDRPRNPQAYPGGRLAEERGDVLGWVFIALAVGADVVAFYTTLALLFGTYALLVVVATAGFTAVAVGAAHRVGVMLKMRKLRIRQSSGVLFWACTLTWVGLGVIAFAARLSVEPVRSGQEIRPLVVAGVFGILYAVSGVLAMSAAYSSYNPALRALHAAERILRQAESHEAETRTAKEAAAADLLSCRNSVDRAADLRRTELAMVEADDAVAEKYAALAILRRLDELDEQ